MFRLILSVYIVLSATSLWASSAQAAWLWSPDSNVWSSSKDTARDTPEAQFQVAKDFYDREDYKRAIEELDKVVEKFPQTRWAAEAQFHKGIAYERLEDIGKAADAFQLVVVRYPYSDRLNNAVEHEFELAEAMLSGGKASFILWTWG